MADEEQGTVQEDKPLTGFIFGLLMTGAAAYVFAQPNAFANDKPVMPWVMGFAGLAGCWMVLSNGLKLYGRHVRKLEPDKAATFADDSLLDGCFGLFKWGFIAIGAFGAYRYVTGPYAALEHGTKLISVLLAAVVALLCYVLATLEKILKKL